VKWDIPYGILVEDWFGGRNVSWQALSLQCVLFSQAQAGLPDALQPWMQLFGAPPLSYQQGPPGGPPQSQATGVVGVYQVIIIAQLGRLEAALSVAPTAGVAFPAIEDIGTGLITLREHAHKLIGLKEGLSRLALLVHLVKQTGSAKASNEDVCRNVKLPSLPDNATDVEFALNVRRPLPVSNNLEINRVCRWSSQVHQLFQVQVRPDGVSQSARVNEMHMSSLQLDLNTVPMEAPLPPAVTLQVFDALVDEAKALIFEGYDRLAAT